MSEHCGYVVKIEHLRKHNNADRLQIATIFGNDVIVGLDTQIGDLGIYFPVDLQLSEEYCRENDLVRRKDENGNAAGGYLDPDKRNIRAMKLRGEKSDGLFMPITSISYIDNSFVNLGDKIDILDGHEICRKYIPRTNKSNNNQREGNRTRKKKVPIAPLFQEHADTEQLVYNLNDFKPLDLVEITLKMHGTSQRTGYLPILKGYNDSFACRAGNTFRKVLAYLREEEDYEIKHDGTPIYDWGYISGTRRVVLEDWVDGGFYGTNAFRKQHADKFEGKLHKGETVYYEVVGFTDTGTPIMSEAPNSRVQDKEFTKQYGKTTVFSYGCSSIPLPPLIVGGEIIRDAIPQSDFYVYRMTMTNEDGDVVEYPPDYMRYRCEQMGVKCVPLLWRGFIPSCYQEVDKDGTLITPGEWIKNKAEEYYDGPDPIGKTHIREGVVCRIVNRPKFTAYKYKNFYFKTIEGIIKDTADAPDMEEAQEVENET